MITSIWTGPGGDPSVAKTLRNTVFCEELGLPQELAWDQIDPYAYHLVLMMGDTPVAAGRIAYGGVGTAKLSRICVAKEFRRQGIGDGLVRIMDYKASQLGMMFSKVDVPRELTPFYLRLGYMPEGTAFSLWGMDFTPMKKGTNDGSGENCAHQCAGT